MPVPRLPLLSQLSVKLTNDSKNGSSFDPSTVFEKWAAVEVIDRSSIPDRMKSHQLTGGFYSVFEYNGPTSGAPKIFNHIFSISLPNSGYKIDNREYFEVLKKDYVPIDQNAQEYQCNQWFKYRISIFKTPFLQNDEAHKTLNPNKDLLPIEPVQS